MPRMPTARFPWPLVALAVLGAASARAQEQVDAAQLVAKGKELALAHDWNVALQVLDRALAAAPDGGPEAERRRCEALLHIGRVHARAGRQDDAVRALARAGALDTRDAWEWSLARTTLRRLLDADH
jgi:tetratricopeptide (TPR) repeat protein